MRKGDKLGYWAFEKAIKVYGVIKQIQEPPSKRTAVSLKSVRPFTLRAAT